MEIRPISGSDIFRWPDGTWCYREDYSELACVQRGDDFEVITADSHEWHQIVVSETA